MGSTSSVSVSLSRAGMLLRYPSKQLKQKRLVTKWKQMQKPTRLTQGGSRLCYCQPQWERRNGASLPLSYIQVSGSRGGVDRLFFAIFQMLFDIAEPIRVHYVDCLRTGRRSHSVNSQRALSYFISFPPPLERGGSCDPLITVMWVSPPNNNISVCITSYCCCSGSRRDSLGLGNSYWGVQSANLLTDWF